MTFKAITGDVRDRASFVVAFYLYGDPQLLVDQDEAKQAIVENTYTRTTIVIIDLMS